MNILSLLKQKYSILVYPDKGSPSLYHLKPWRFKLYLLFMPIVSVICLLAIISVAIYFKQIREYAKKSEPEKFEILRNENQTLMTKVNELETFSNELQKKLASTSAEPEEGANDLSLFQIPVGFQDLSRKPVYSIREISLTIQADSSQDNSVLNSEKNTSDGLLKLSFNIHNESKNDEKLAGYFFVILKNKNGVSVYPKVSNKENFQFTFNEGEYFATTRFRPVVTTFEVKAPYQDNYLFKILIFSRSGDLNYKLTKLMTVGTQEPSL